MSNVLKKGSATYKEERIIDYNDILKEKIKSMSELSERNKMRMDADGFVNGLEAEVIEEADYDDVEEDALQALTAENDSFNSVESANEEAQIIINEANEEAHIIIENAKNEALQLQQDAKENGYSEGAEIAKQEYEERNALLEQEYNDRRIQLEQEYQKLKETIEPELVNTLVEVFAKVTHTIAEDNKEIVLHLINDVIKNAETSHEFMIKVSPDDYQFLVNNQGKIYCAMSNEVNIEIVQDAMLKSSECIIETDTGVFNCSLDIELNNLIKQIKLLSCI